MKTIVCVCPILIVILSCSSNKDGGNDAADSSLDVASETSDSAHTDSAGDTGSISEAANDSGGEAEVDAGCNVATGSPLTSPCILATGGAGIYVDAVRGSNGASATGTYSNPFATIGKGTQSANAISGMAKRVFVCGGDSRFTYPEVVQLVNGVNVYGNVDCSSNGEGKVFLTNGVTKIAPTQLGSNLAPVVGDSTIVSAIEFAGFTVVAPDAPTTSGAMVYSSIGMFFNGSTVSLSNVTITAGKGGNGYSGVSATGTAASGGAGGSYIEFSGSSIPLTLHYGTANADGTFTNGGTGGQVGASGTPNPVLSASGGTVGTAGVLAAGANGTGSSTVGSGCGLGLLGGGATCPTINSSNVGCGGANGTAPAVPATPTLDGTGFHPSVAGNGGKGAPGGGGGSGGGAWSSGVGGAGAFAGGGGGGGGYGGAGGGGGSGAGGSFGIVSLGGTLTLANVTITTSTGGTGGPGGAGQTGGGGGGGGAGDSNYACPGAAGGAGGNGADGGGGNGGPSVGILYHGTAPTMTSMVFTLGTGGLAGTSNSLPGDVGVVQNSLSL